MLPLRAQFLEALRGPSAAGIPRVLLEFRSHGQQMSQDNKVRERPDVPDNLGPDPDPGDGRNWMEIRGTVIGHRSELILTTAILAFALNGHTDDLVDEVSRMRSTLGHRKPVKMGRE